MKNFQFTFDGFKVTEARLTVAKGEIKSFEFYRSYL